MPSKFFRYKKSTLHFTTIGNGLKTLFMFHGFGQDNTSFHSLSTIFPAQYTVYIFDLYFHGHSHWGYGESPLEKAHWKETIQEFLRENSIDHFSIGGFSLGGKFALATFEAWPEKTREIILLAPDGIKTSFWYSLATYPHFFRKIFKSMIHRPERFISITKILYSLGLVDKGLLKFSEFQMNSEEKRSRVYCSWVVFRHLKFDMNKIAGLINLYNIPITVVVGKYDKVIEAKRMEHLLKKLNHYRFEIPEVGHTALIAASHLYFASMD